MSLSTRPKARLVNEKNKVTILQRIGVVIIIAGLLGLITSLFFHSDGAENHHQNAVSAPIAAISFFITMLGVAFAFPTMLRGKEGISTMRIVVFMMANVICMLLIKCGWQVESLEQIGLDEWWMGVIAFVFGAKATQSYFESKLAVPHDTKNGNSTPVVNTPENSGTDDTYTQAEVARFAVAQNEQNLRIQFPNIVSVSDTVADLSKPDSHVVALYLKDDNAARIPAQLEAKMPDGSVQNIATEVIKGGGTAVIHLSQEDTVAEVGFPLDIGSICCAVKSKRKPDFLGIVTAGHVYTKGSFLTNNNTFLDASLQLKVAFNGITQGKWFYKQLLDNQDLIVVQMDRGITADSFEKLIRFNDQYYCVSDADISNTEVTIQAGNRQYQAYILDYGVKKYPIRYGNGTFEKNDLILIGNSRNRQNAKPVSQPGDSGACVYVEVGGQKQLVGILLGSDVNFTFVLPVKDTLSPNFKIV